MPLFGVSVALPAPCGEELQTYRVSLGEEAAQGIPAHITLMPPQELPLTAYEEVVRHLEYVAAGHPAYRVHLRGTGTFRPVSPVVFICVVEGISACELLARDVCAGLRRDQERFPYHPHVTIAQGLGEAELDRAFADMAFWEASFEVGSFWLYRHDDPGGWAPVREFPLRG